MAEQTFSVNSGFYDAVSSDRTYSAEDMNKPYKRLVANGVFATNLGTPSTDLQVKAGSGMVINVQPGQGIFANKWFENPSVINITVDSNSTLYSRIDSIIAQIDNTVGGRVGSIVYRPGTPNAYPEPPEINTVDNVIEYRIANIAVVPSASAITQANIADLRGSASCPWVTALIQQVDTSVLYEQWDKAYSDYYEASTTAWEAYLAAKQAEWDAFWDELTQDLTLTTNVERLYSTYTTVGDETTTIPVGIASYDEDTDILLVFINGILVQGAGWYSYTAGTNSIELVNSLPEGQTVDFVVLKSVITGDISSVETQIQSIETALATATSDSGWINLTLQNNAVAYSSDYTPETRLIGKQVSIRGAIKGETILGTTIFTVPVACRPSKPYIYPVQVISGNSIVNTAAIQILTDGQAKLFAASGTIDATAMVLVGTTYTAG